MGQPLTEISNLIILLIIENIHCSNLEKKFQEVRFQSLIQNEFYLASVCTLIHFSWEININVYERSLQLYKLDQTLMLLQETLDDPLWQMKLTEEEEGAHTVLLSG